MDVELSGVPSDGEGILSGFHADQERFPDLSDRSNIANGAFEVSYSSIVRP